MIRHGWAWSPSFPSTRGSRITGTGPGWITQTTAPTSPYDSKTDRTTYFNPRTKLINRIVITAQVADQTPYRLEVSFTYGKTGVFDRRIFDGQPSCASVGY